MKADWLLDYAVKAFKLDVHGIHGVRHWRMVRENGLMLAHESGADPEVVELFAFLHDSERLSDDSDPDHGSRAAEVVCGMSLGLSAKQKADLVTAILFHCEGIRSDVATIGTCWDADRLDLIRLGIDPDPDLMSTDIGKRVAEKLCERRFAQMAADMEARRIGRLAANEEVAE